jgi:hypothetical protein
MAAHSVESSFRFPDLIATPAHPDGISVPESQRGLPNHGLGAFRGLAFALVFEGLLGVVAFSGWQLWRVLH